MPKKQVAIKRVIKGTGSVWLSVGYVSSERFIEIVSEEYSIGGARLQATQVVVLRNDLQKPSDPQDGLLPAAPFKSVFFDRTNATVIFSPAPGPFSMAAFQQP